ncbi:MAG: hypothetical protein ACYDAR_18170 [Thermomicrobiales bacterium]
MAMPDWLNIQTSDLPGYVPPPKWWRGPDMEVFAIQNTSLAFVVYNQDDISVSTTAGNFAIFREQECTERLFAPRNWLIVAAPFSVRSAGEPAIVLVYIANGRESIEKYALVDLDAHRFVPLFIPNPLFNYIFTQLDTDQFAMIPPGDRDVPPYRRSYLIETSTLAWQPFRRNDDGFDDTTIAEPMRNLIWHQRPVSWHIVWDRAYRLTLPEETPNDAKIVSDRVLDRINADSFLIPLQGGYAVEADERRLRPLIAEERANLYRERGEQL